MTDKEGRKIAKGFFKAFYHEMTKLKKSTAVELLRVKEGELAPEDTLEFLVERIRMSGELRTFLQDVFRYAHLEPEDFKEFQLVMIVWQDADKFILNSYSEIQKACKADRQSREQGCNTSQVKLPLKNQTRQNEPYRRRNERVPFWNKLNLCKKCTN